jgi:hypothetical protein
MRLRNTSRYPTEEVGRLVAFAFGELDTGRLAVHVKNGRAPYAGRAYRGVPLVSPEAASADVDQLVTIRLGAPNRFPVDNLSVSWRYYPWQDADAPPPPGYDPSMWAWRGRRSGRLVEVRYLEPVHHPYGGKSSPLIVMADWREALVTVAAHEARHVHQFQHNAPRSEVDAERFAAGVLDAFRRVDA